MPILGAVADDLTGATTVGVLLARSKARTAVFFNEEAALRRQGALELDAVIISSNTRPLSPEEAYEKVHWATKALLGMGVRYLSKRIDTTLRGEIGAETDAMLDCMEEGTIAVAVPAMPQSRRIVVGGYSIIDGVALVDTPVARDVRTPVYENCIPKLLDGQSRRKIGTVCLEHILKGRAEVKRALKHAREQGAGIIVTDAITMEHVELVARACVELKWNVLAVDPGPFTSKLAYVRGIISEEESNIPCRTADGTGKTVLIAAGSATPVTKRQMEVLCGDSRHLRIPVDPVSLINGAEEGAGEVERAAQTAADMIRNQSPRVILLETALHGSPLDLCEEDRKRGYEKGISSNRINSGIGAIVAGIFERVGRESIAGIYTTGGDTMVNVCRHLETECLEVVDYVIAQTDVGRLTGRYEGLPIIGKGGLTGNDHTALQIVDRLFQEAARDASRAD